MPGSLLSPALRKALTAPSKLASALDWKKATSAAAASVASVCIRPKGQGIDVAILNGDDAPTEHHLSSFSELKPLLPPQTCGLVVEWPLSSNGRMGGPCGTVLRALEEGTGDLSVPVCLWDPHHSDGPYDHADVFGRCAKYGVPLTVGNDWKTEVHNRPAAPMGALNLWQDFARVHWPNQAAEEASEPIAVSAPLPNQERSSERWSASGRLGKPALDKKKVLIFSKV